MKIEIREGKAYIDTPYNEDFIDAIKGIGGAEWEKDEKVWSIPEQAIDAAREIMLRIYGESDIQEDEKITVRMTFEDGYREDRRPITIMGKTVAKAYGRDSGATVGEDVCVIVGHVGSGGSAKNWQTRLGDDSVIMLNNVSKALFEKEKDFWETKAKVEAIGPKAEYKKANLMEEKGKLLSRLAEIEQELNK